MSDEAFERDLERAMAILRERRGECPPAGLLEAFLSGELDPERTALVERHLLLCGECDVLLSRLKSSAGADLEASPALESVILRRLEGPKRKQTRPWYLFLLRPSFAYTLCALLIIPALRGLFVRQEPARERTPTPAAVPAVAPAIHPVEVADLNEFRRGTTEKASVPFDDKTFVLRFWIPARIGLNYLVAVTDNENHEVLRPTNIRPTRQGNVYLLCDERLSRGKKYVLMISGLDPATGKTLQSHRFEFSP